MKKYLLPFLFAASVFIACTNEDKKTTEEKDTSGLMDATRNFIRAALDGKFQEAKRFMLLDSSNVQYLENAEKNYNRLDTLSKESYAASSIIIHSKDEKIKDSLAIVIYSNSFKNDRDTLRLLKQNNQWLVDLKYLYEHDYDTLMRHIPKDTLR